ncbi:toxin 45 family protein [Bacillus pseudomycoides]|nr:polymorphic toxin type 17 domain-containing protein [Bacillus pseudomycoides]AIK38969.1 toxin 45 family protein [Bacillus pseudomycoides]AJI15023.1 toxin 45 family protein [Bacillus pseudomycoides]
MWNTLPHLFCSFHCNYRQTCCSAKSFFIQTFRPLAQGIIYLCEELIRQNDAFPSQFQSQVASTDVIEQEILEQIQEIDRMKASMEAVIQAMPIPGMDAMANLFTVMKHKLQEKLDHLHEFNQTSSNNYSTAIQLAASIATGLAEVQSGKGFSLTSGTFSTQELNMEWTTSIQAITEDRKRQSEEESTIDKSLLDRFKDAVENKIEAMDQLSENFFHQIENTPLLGQYYNYKKGQNEAVLDELKGILNTVLHPIDSFESAVYALSHIDETFAAVEQAISDSWNQDVVNGDWNSRAKWAGNVEMQVKLALAELLVGTKGVGKISKFGKFSRLSETSTLSESVNFIQGIKNVIHFDKLKQSVDMLNNILMPKNQFALANTNGLDLRFFNEAKDMGNDAYGGYYKRKEERGVEYQNNITNPMTRAELPNKGHFRFIPGKEVKFNRQLNGYVDKFGNVWTKGPYHGDPKKNFEFEWDVQLSEKGLKEWGKYTKNGKKYINVAPDGTISH